MKIALLANATNNHTVRWAKYLASAGHQTLILSDTPASLAIAGVKVATPKMDLATRFVAFKLIDSEFGNNRFKYRAYMRPMEEFRPDIVVAMEALSYGPVLAHWDGTPRVLMPWGSDILVWARKASAARELVEQAISAADCLTANAPGMETELFAGLKSRPASMKLFAWGCDTNIFSRGDGAARTDARRALSLPLDARIVLSPRNATNHLGAGMIVESWMVARRTSLPPTDLLVLLRGSAPEPEWNALQQHAARLGDASSIRFVADYADASRMAYHFRASDAFISFPETDFFAVSIMEGMACGSMPILAPLPAYKGPMAPIPNQRDAFGAIIAESRSVPALVEALQRWSSLAVGQDRAIREFNAERAQRTGSFATNARQLEEVFAMAKAAHAARPA